MVSVKSKRFARRRHCSDKKKAGKKDLRNKEQKKEGKRSSKKSTIARSPMYHSESGVSVFNRRRLFLTSLPCLSFLAALKPPFFPRERCIAGSNELSGFFLDINIVRVIELTY